MEHLQEHQIPSSHFHNSLARTIAQIRELHGAGACVFDVLVKLIEGCHEQQFPEDHPKGEELRL